MNLAFDIVSYAAAAIVLYYSALFAASLWSTRRTPAAGADPLFVLVVPAHNEHAVIGQTVTRLRELRGRFIALIIDDGSSDGTYEAAVAAGEGDARVKVLRRPPEVAGQGKGEVLNHAYRVICGMIEGDLFGVTVAPADVVVGIIDADGWLEPHALQVVAPYYGDERVAGVQLPVRIWNTRAGFLTRLQDIEFIGFSLFVQAGRDPVGSVGLGGNGQFVRLAALMTLGASPWTRCLTEDLDVGLSLVERGWRNRFCPRACVSQQALDRLRPFFRQRTRWIQGHYQCWSHLPALWRTSQASLRTRIDLSLYLVLVAFIPVLAVQMALGVASAFGILSVETTFLWFIGDGQLYRAVTLGLSFAPLVAFAVTYQRFAADPLPGWALPGLFLAFAVYGYFWAVPATLRAWGRTLLRRGSWVKTPRVVISADDLRAEARALAASTARVSA